MHWNIDPVIFSFGSFELRYYPLMFIIAFVLMEKVVVKIFENKGKNPEICSTLLTYIILGMIIGARLGHCLFYDPGYYLTHPLEIFMTWKGGLASHGGFFGVFVGVYLALKKYPGQVPYLWLMDTIAGPCLFVAGFIRLGNLFNSEIYGKVTKVPWGIVFDRVDPLVRHPSQIYESLGYFTISGILFYLYRKFSDNWGHGKITGIALMISFGFRFLVEFTKDNQSEISQALPINMGQILSLAAVGAGFWFYKRAIKLRK